MSTWRAIALCCTCVVSLCRSEAAAPEGYYAAAEGKTGRALREALHDRIKDHQVVRYANSAGLDTLDAIKVLDEDPADTNNVILIYSGWSVPKTNFNVVSWNREHLWPDSYGFDGKESWPPMCDLFNLRPCDSRVNSARSNKYFDLSNPGDRNYRASAHTNAPSCSADTDSWEPPDSMKGDIARALLYMDLRYNGSQPEQPDLTLTENIDVVASGSTFMGRLSTLLLWNRQDLVDVAETRRNDLIYERYQRNRNPFVDHPEWAELVFLPRLGITSMPAQQLRITWEVQWTNALLERAEGPGLWLVVPNPRVILDGQVIVDELSTNTSSLYRLRPF